MTQKVNGFRGFWGKLVPKTTFFVLGVAEFFEEFFLTLAQVVLGLNNDGHNMRAAVAVAAHQGDAVAGQF